MIDLDLGSCCPDFVAQWRGWAERLAHPAAFQACRPPLDYYATVRKDAKYQLRKCERQFDVSPFIYNNFRDEIHRVNTSKAVRQGKPMTKVYQDFPPPTRNEDHCFHHHRVWLGAFDKETQALEAYAQIVVCGNLAVMNKFIGTRAGEIGGAMYGLVSQALAGAYIHQCEWMNYLDLRSCRSGLARFKRNVGFIEMDWRLT